MTSEVLDRIFGQNSYINNCTLFHIIASSGCDEILDFIYNSVEGRELEHVLKLKNKDGETALHTAVKWVRGDVADTMIAQMADMGADWNAQEDATGNTVLHIAVEKRDHELVKWLLFMPVDPNIQNLSGLTPRQLAEKSGDQDLIDLFSVKNTSL